MVNPLAPVFDWFIAFLKLIPPPAYAFLGMVLVLYFAFSLLRWFV